MLPRPLKLAPAAVVAIVLAGLAAGESVIQEEEGAATEKSHRERLKRLRKLDRARDRDQGR